MAQEAEKSNSLEILFPEREIKTDDGTVVCTVRPLSLKNFSKVADAFSKIAKEVDGGMGPAELTSTSLTQILELLPYCVNKSVDDIPATFIPEIIEIVVDQNMKEPTLKKWSSLVDRVIALSEKAGELTGKTVTKTS